MVLVGAEGVVENGGVINKLGTYQLSLCARAHGIPFYVAAESYKVPNLQAAIMMLRAMFETPTTLRQHCSQTQHATYPTRAY